MDFMNKLKEMYTRSNCTSDRIVLGGECLSYRADLPPVYSPAVISEEMLKAHKLADSLLEKCALAAKTTTKKIIPIQTNQTDSYLKHVQA